MKPFWFAFNITDWLASKSVRMMSLAERGAYIGLLATAWGEDVPGTLPLDTDEVRRLAEMTPEQWAVSGACLLKKFPISECGTFRYNPRLLADGQEQKRKSEKAAEAGRRSAEVKKQRNANGTPTDVAKKPTDVEKTATECQLVTTTITSSTDVEEREANSAAAPTPAPALKASTQAKTYAPPADDAVLFTADTWPGLVNPATFASICTDLRLPIDLDRETYRAAIQDKMRSQGIEAPPKSLRSWISAYFINEKKRGPLLSLTVGLPTVPTPRNELPAKGQERQGQVIAIQGENDKYVNKQLAASWQQQYPAATIHIISPR